MFDPGALGTLINGLDNEKRRQDAYDHPDRMPTPASPPQLSTRSRARVTLARSLRGLGDRLEGRPGAISDSGSEPSLTGDPC